VSSHSGTCGRLECKLLHPYYILLTTIHTIIVVRVTLAIERRKTINAQGADNEMIYIHQMNRVNSHNDFNHDVKKAKVAHTRLPSVRFRS